MGKNVIQRLTASSTWAASSDMTPIDLPKDGLITEITIRSNITATLTATALDDCFRRHLQNIRIQGDGGKAYLGMSGTQMSRLLSLWQEIEGLGPSLHSNGGGIALAAPDVGSTIFNTIFKFHPGSNPRDPFDLTAAIPARALSTLQALLTTTGNAVVDANGTISAGTFNYEVNVVLNERVPRGLMVPMGSTLSYAHTANYSDFSYDIDVPAGAFLRSIIMLIQDDTSVVPRRKDDEVTGVKLKRPKAGDFVFEQSIRELKQTMMARHGIRAMSHDVGPIGAIATIRPAPGAAMAIVPSGFVVIDLRPFGDPRYGLDLRGYQTGDYKLGLTIENYASGDDTIIYWDQVAPVSAEYVGK